MLSELATKIWKEKYAWPGEETYAATVDRMIRAWGEHPNADAETLALLRADMLAQRAAPNSPQWFNVGSRESDQRNWDINGQRSDRPLLGACFILSLEDTMESISQNWAAAARIFHAGAGVGVNYGALRGVGEPVGDNGHSSGLVSFLRVDDAIAGSVKSGGRTRRAARMITVPLEHPEIFDVCRWKVDEEAKAVAMSIGSRLPTFNRPDKARQKYFGAPPTYSLDWRGEALRSVSGQNGNISILVEGADFFSVLDKDGDWETTNRKSGISRPVPARDLWDAITQAAWATGDPGIQFADLIRAGAPLPAGSEFGEIHASNPCSEHIFYDDTGCNLASIRLTAFLADNGEFDFASFRQAARRWTRLLDWTIDLAGYPTRAIADRTRALRPLGLGFADLGGLLLRMGLHYDSDQARTLAHDIATAMTGAAREESEELAEKHGLAPALQWGSFIAHVARKLGGTGRIRNLQLTAIAPTGTIGLLMDCDTTGIEPIFGVNTTKNLEGGGFIELPNPAIAVAQAKHGKTAEWAEAQTAGNLSATAHLLMVAAVQSAVSSGISKTVNLHTNTTSEEIGWVYQLAHALGIKAISVYRDGSKLSQPLSQKKVMCVVCGNESMIPNGTCHVCEVCGATTGC